MADELNTNPFDTFEGPESLPASEGLQPGQPPSLWESITTNLAGTHRKIIEYQPRHFIDSRTIERAEHEGVAQPGDSPFAGRVSQDELDQARGRLSTRKRDIEAYETFESPTIAGKAAGLVGGLLGAAAAPSSLITAGGVVVKGVGLGLTRLGVGATTARVIGAGAEAGAVNAGLDAAGQALEVGAGLQEQFNPLQSAIAFGGGAVLGSGMQGVAELASRRHYTLPPEVAGELAPSADAILPEARQATPAVQGEPPPLPDDPAAPASAGTVQAAAGEQSPAVVVSEPAAAAPEGAPSPSSAEGQPSATPQAAAVPLNPEAVTAPEIAPAAVENPGLEPNLPGIRPDPAATAPPVRGPEAPGSLTLPDVAPASDGAGQASLALPDVGTAPVPAEGNTITVAPLDGTRAPPAEQTTVIRDVALQADAGAQATGAMPDAPAAAAPAPASSMPAHRIATGEARYVELGGQRYVAREDGSDVLGQITPDVAAAVGREAAPIRLALGEHDAATGKGFGEAHIEARHGGEIRAAGFQDAASFVGYVTSEFNAVYKGARGRLLLVKQNGRSKVAVVELGPSADAGSSQWSVTSASLYRPDYFVGKSELWRRPGPDASLPSGRSLFDPEGQSQTTIRPGARGNNEPDAQPMAARPGVGTASPALNPDSRFPDRRLLPGEDTKPRTLPTNATPEEVHAFRVTDAMRSIADRLGRKLEVDGRFTARGALGEHKRSSGVLRIRFEGDFEVFAHEVGHAVDQGLTNTVTTAAEWNALRTRHTGELKALDANAADPAQRTVDEGVAEFLRSYVTNPAYARRQAPNFAADFERFLTARNPALAQILADASRASQIDSGMTPVDQMRTMVSSGLKLTGVAQFKNEAARFGVPRTLSLWFDRFYAGAFGGRSHWVKRYVDHLREAQYQKTGKPLPEFGWADPAKMHRQLPGALQAGVDAIYNGIRGYGRALDAPESASIHDALSKAFDGRVTLIENPDDPLVRSFSGYLIARRARALYDRFEAGELRNAPVRASRNSVHAAIAEFEALYPTFREAADDLFDVSRALWQKKFESGLVSREVYDLVAGRGEDHLPFFRDMEDDDSLRAITGNGAGQERSVVKRFKGSTRNIIDPVHSLIFDIAQTERIIAWNDIIRSLDRLARSGGEFSGRFLERVPNTEVKAQSVDLAEGIRARMKEAGVDKADAEIVLRHLEDLVGEDMTATVFKREETTARGERILFFWDAGERIPLKTGSDAYSKAFFEAVSMMTSSERDVFMAAIGRGNALFSQLITNAPEFAIKNLLMDNISRIFIARNTGVMGRVPGASIAMGVYTQIFDRAFARAYSAMGGIRGGVASAAARDLQDARGLGFVTMKPKTVAQMGAELKALAGNPKDLLFTVAKSPWEALKLVIQGIEATETAGRLGQAKIVFRHLKKQGLDDTTAMQGAVYEARDILDYDRRGTHAVAATRIIPFLNVGIQGIDRSGRVLFGDPLQAALQAYRRGGYDKLDEAHKTALADAVRNWGMIALGAVGTMSYAYWNADNPTYQRMSDYMRRRYYIFPAGETKDGEVNVVTIPKPFDHAGGILSAVEAAVDGIRRADPEGWDRVGKALLDGFVPRQLTSWHEFLSGQPFVKVGAEVATGTRFGFEGTAPRPIVPQALKALPPEQQFTGATSWLAKKMGDWFGVSPMVADHVMNGLGATTARDGNALLTAAFDDQPNMTPRDAMTRLFFGGLYRSVKGGGAFRSDLLELMGNDNGQYVVAANGYRRALEEGDSDEAATIYARANDTARTLLTLRGHEFKPELRQLHPLERTATIGEVASKVMRDLSRSRVEVLDRSRKRGEEREYIEVQPTTARAIANTLGNLMAEETRNGLSIAGHPGYEMYPVIDTSERLAAIRELSPQVADELARRLKKAHVRPIAEVEKHWPLVRERLLKDREKARLTGLR